MCPTRHQPLLFYVVDDDDDDFAPSFLDDACLSRVGEGVSTNERNLRRKRNDYQRQKESDNLGGMTSGNGRKQVTENKQKNTRQS